jgi:hypothetical protein
MYSKGSPSSITASDSAGHEEVLQARAHKARGIIDISHLTLVDIPFTIEEKLRKTKGVFSVQINAFSKKLAIEFDPSVISLDEIVRKISRAQPRRQYS